MIIATERWIALIRLLLLILRDDEYVKISDCI